MSIANDFLRPARIVAVAAAAVFLMVSANGAFARGGGHNGGGYGDNIGGGQDLHGPGTSHNPIVVGAAGGDVHGPGTSHNPIIVGGRDMHGPGTAHNPIIVGGKKGNGRNHFWWWFAKHHGRDHDHHASNIRGNCEVGCVVHQHGPTVPSGQPSGPMRQSFM
jgi:hypothetical protein